MLNATETALPGIGLSIPQVVERPAAPFVAYRIGGQMRELPNFAPPHIDRLANWIGERAIAGAGPMFFRYRRFGGDGSVSLDVGALTEIPQAGGDGVEAGELPAGRYALATYTGPYDRLYDAMAMLNGWITGRGLKTAGRENADGSEVDCQTEIYRVSPVDVADPAKYETDLLILLA